MLAGAAQAPAAATCVRSGTSLQVTGDEVHLAVAPDGAILSDGASCDGATVTDIDTIVVLKGGGGHAFLTIDESGGFLGPGATPESDGVSEIEVQLPEHGFPAWDVVLTGTPGPDAIAVSDAGIDLGGDGDVDVQTQRLIEVDGGAGDDRLAVTSSRVVGPYGPFVNGDAGNDVLTVTGSLLGSFVTGGPGSDTLDLAQQTDDLGADLETGRGTIGPVGFPFAFGDDFENAVGGSGDDHLLG